MNRPLVCSLLFLLVVACLSASSSAQAPPVRKQVLPAPPIMPARVDDAGRIVLREHIKKMGAIQLTPVPKNNPVATTITTRQDLNNRTISRTLEAKEVSVFDAKGQPVASDTLAQKLGKWTPVFVIYSMASSPAPGKKSDIAPGSGMITWMERFGNDSLLMMVPYPVLRSTDVRVIDKPMPPAPDCILVSFSNGSLAAKKMYKVTKPVWETRTKDMVYTTANGENRVKTHTYKVCKFVPELRVNSSIWKPEALVKNIRQVDGTPVDMATLQERLKRPTLVLSAQDSRPIHPFYLRAFKPDTFMAVYVPSQSPAINVAREFGDRIPLIGSVSDPLELTTLNVARKRDFGDEQLAKMKESKNINSLDLSSTSVTNAGLKHLEGFEKMTVLKLNYTGITDATLPELAKLNQLETLSLQGNKGITDKGLVHLADLKTLRSLNLTRTGCTAKGIEMLEKANPDLFIQALGIVPQTR